MIRSRKSGPTGWEPSERLGFALNSMLLYATGGLAISDLEYRVRNNSTAGTGIGTLSGSNRTKDAGIGWALGGGAAHAFTENWSVEGEYLYVHFDGERPCGQGFGVTWCFQFDDTKVYMVRVGANYRF